jgi:hypothetical protein
VAAPCAPSRQIKLLGATRDQLRAYGAAQTFVCGLDCLRCLPISSGR